jgi:hypothetical protein
VAHTPHLILWCAFAGSWLLVAGPLHQGTIELERETQESAEFLIALRDQRRPPSRSRWWWLLPPVAIVLGARESRRQQKRMTDELTRDQLAALTSLREKASAWLFVAGGAFLLAIDATWNLRESYEWPVWVFWALLASMLLVCFIYTSYRNFLRHGAHTGDAPS